jgi:hypothetical protein
MTWTVGTYVVYLLATVPLTIWVATTLSRHGRVFLEEVFAGDEALAHAVNRLLVVGFYLLNLGFVMLFLRVSDAVFDLRGLIETLSLKIGVVLLATGAVHLLNVYAFNAIRRRSRQERMPVPPAPPRSNLSPTQPAYPR